MTTFFSDEDEELTPSIEHGLDCMASPDGKSLEFHYNFLDYQFMDGQETIFARHYMDDPGIVSVNVLTEAELRTAFARKVLVYLAMRYERLKWPSDLEDDGLPADLLRGIETIVVKRLGLNPA